jgi:hypothetical protein
LIGNFGFIHVKGKRLTQPKAHDSFCLLSFEGQRLKIEKSDSDCGIGEDCGHIAGTRADVALYLPECAENRIALAQVSFGQIGHYAPWRQFAGGAQVQHLAGIGSPCGNDPIGCDFAGDLRLA